MATETDNLPAILRAPTSEEIARARLPERYEAACTAIAECVRIDELKELADRQAALASYARAAKDETLFLGARRFQARAARRFGELLKEIPSAQGQRTDQLPVGALPKLTREVAASAAGLSEHQAKQGMRLASIPAEDFEAAVENDRPPTVTALAERGTQPLTVERASLQAARDAQRVLREFAAFCATHDAVALAQAAEDAEALRGYYETIDAWLDRFVTNLAQP